MPWARPRGVSYWRRESLRWPGSSRHGARCGCRHWTRSGTSRPAVRRLQEEGIPAAREDPPALPDPQVLTAARVEAEAVLAGDLREKTGGLEPCWQPDSGRRPALHRP